MASEKGKGSKSKDHVANPVAASLLHFAQETNKAEVVRSLIQEHGANGLTPSQMRALLESRKFEMPTNYLYAVLLRAKRAGHVMERNGKYFPADDKEKAAS